MGEQDVELIPFGRMTLKNEMKKEVLEVAAEEAVQERKLIRQARNGLHKNDSLS